MKRRTIAQGMFIFASLATQFAIETNASAQPLAQHWDVAGLQAESAANGYTFQVGENWVTRYLQEGGSMQNITGLVRPPNWDQNARFVAFSNEEEAAIPKDFDWRRLVSGGLQPIRNQGGCGSCWAFSITSVVESLNIIAHGHSSIDLAEQTLVSSCEAGGSCAGGYFDAFNYVQSPGLPDETDDPYTARNSSCRRDLSAKANIVRWSYIGAQGREPTTEEIKAAIFKYGPVSVDVNGSFGAYSGGIYNNCVGGGTNHMVTLEGWDDTDQVWIMRNSWGAEWGENGYMRIKYTDGRGRKCNGIGQVAAFAEL